MSFNPYTQAIETKLYLVVFTLFSSFLAIVIYNFSFDNIISSDDINDSGVKVSVPHSQKEVPSRAIDSKESSGIHPQ